MKPSKRKVALAIIRTEFAEHGRATMLSSRAYIENRISHTAYLEAVQNGMRIYEKRV